MNKVLLGICIVLLIAVGWLFFAFYAKTPAQPVVKNSGRTDSVKFKIVYFDMDTLESKYEYAKETRDYLKTKNDAMDSKLAKIRNDYAAKVNDYNKRGATLSQTEQSQMQDDLQRMDAYYSQQQQSLSQQFQGEYMQKMLNLKNKIQDILKTYSQQQGYEFVISTSSDDNVVYYKDTLRDITNELVNILNDDFKKSQKK